VIAAVTLNDNDHCMSGLPPRDADPQGQQSTADYQHEKLMEKIKEVDPTTKV
jgi:hypothetical protein